MNIKIMILLIINTPRHFELVDLLLLIPFSILSFSIYTAIKLTKLEKKEKEQKKFIEETCKPQTYSQVVKWYIASLTWVGGSAVPVACGIAFKFLDITNFTLVENIPDVSWGFNSEEEAITYINKISNVKKFFTIIKLVTYVADERELKSK